MRVTLSAAVTADGYMDDDSPRRLIISTPGDWEEVYRLGAAHDAILAGIACGEEPQAMPTATCFRRKK